jgi:hypothetical protein
LRWSWFGDFFGAIPDALRALYQFGDPNSRGDGWWAFIILVIWGAGLIGAPLFLAKRWYGKHEWASAAMGVMAGTAVLWWVFGVLPSSWIYFLDANKEILADRIIPTSFTLTIGGTKLDIASNLYNVIRDTVVVVEHLVAFGLTFWAAIKIQQRYPRTLVAGEIKPEAGGYK